MSLFGTKRKDAGDMTPAEAELAKAAILRARADAEKERAVAMAEKAAFHFWECERRVKAEAGK